MLCNFVGFIIRKLCRNTHMHDFGVDRLTACMHGLFGVF